MAILVSGASGFLGSRLVARLAEEGRDVIALARRERPDSLAKKSQVQWLRCDLTQQDWRSALPRLPHLEAVVHLAGATLGAGQDECAFLHRNEHTTVSLLQALADRCEQVVHASSQVVYGDARHLAVDESFPLRAEGSAYALSKLNSENWLQWFQKRHGGRYWALRFCGFVDGGGIVDYLINQALNEEAIELYGLGEVRRDYLHSSDGMDALVKAVDCQAAVGVTPVNIGSGQAVSAKELAQEVCTTLQSASEIHLRPAPSPQGDFVFSIARARQLLNFQPGDLKAAVRQHAQTRQQQTRSSP